MIKVNYDPKTTLVKGYYPDSINYASIPEPFIEITEEQHQEALGKQMCVIKGVFQEYVIPDSDLLEEGKIFKIAQCKAELAKTDWQGAAYLKRGRPIDPGIKEKETEIVNLISQIENCTTLKQLEKINVNFE